jgi:hypothetical protein
MYKCDLSKSQQIFQIKLVGFKDLTVKQNKRIFLFQVKNLECKKHQLKIPKIN